MGRGKIRRTGGQQQAVATAEVIVALDTKAEAAILVAQDVHSSFFRQIHEYTTQMVYECTSKDVLVIDILPPHH